MKKAPNSTFRVTDARFGVTIAVQARNPSTAYCRYLSAANKRLQPTTKTKVVTEWLTDGRGELHARPIEVTTTAVRMLGHAPTNSDTGGWQGVSIERVAA